MAISPVATTGLVPIRTRPCAPPAPTETALAETAATEAPGPALAGAEPTRVWAHVRRAAAAPDESPCLASRVARMYDRYSRPSRQTSRLNVCA